MTVQHDPPRWLDDPELSREVARELTAYTKHAPALEQRARMMSGLEAELGLSATSPASQPLPRVGQGLGKLKLVLGSATLLAGAIGLFVWSMRAPVPAHVPPAPVPLIVQPAAPSAELEEPSLEPELAQESADLTVPPASAARPRARRTRLAPVPAPAEVPVQALLPEAPASPLAESRSDVVAELALLAQARRALLSKPAHALEFTERHARDYPQGTFGEEREVLAIESLMRLGLVDEARQRAATFERQYPSSAHRAHLSRMMSGLDP